MSDENDKPASEWLKEYNFAVGVTKGGNPHDFNAFLAEFEQRIRKDERKAVTWEFVNALPIETTNWQGAMLHEVLEHAVDTGFSDEAVQVKWMIDRLGKQLAVAQARIEELEQFGR